MKFILNISVDPHFCVLFENSNKVIDKFEWSNRKKDGEIVFEFLQKHDVANKNLNFCGGVSGPGGFSSLRAGAGILNALGTAKNINVRQIRADKWVTAFLKEHGSNAPFLLNSFSDGVFYVDGAKLIRTTIDEAVKKFENEKIFVELLPEEKRNKFNNKIKIPFTKTETSLLHVLDNQKPQKMFIPDYEFPAVS